MAQVSPAPDGGDDRAADAVPEPPQPDGLRGAARDDGANGAAQPETSAKKLDLETKAPANVPKKPDSVDPVKELPEAHVEEDGTSAEELLARINTVKVRPDYLLERMHLESQMFFTIGKVANFLLYFIHFLLAMYEFCPANHFSMVHRQIGEHFGLSKMDKVKTFQDVYDFMGHFEHANEELQASSYHFWCEKRYSSLEWNTHLNYPQKICNSPRQNALGAPTYDAHKCPHCHGMKWADWKAMGSTSSTGGHGSSAGHGSAPASGSHGSASASAGHGSASASDGHRRLRGEVSQEIRDEVRQRKLRSLAAAGGKAGEHVCHDFDDLLEKKEKIPGITCASSAAMVCDLEAGLLLCEKSCGYCPPFEYVRTRKFEKPMVTLLPVVVFQTRYPEVSCKPKEYASTYNKQTTNPNLVILPTLDGPRNDQLVRCLDRSQLMDSEYAKNTACPEGYCSGDVFKDTPKAEFHGIPIYPKMLIEPHKDLLGMRNIDWLDIQTKDVSLSTMIYTEDLEIFTSVTTEFSVDSTGKIKGNKMIQSYKEFLDDERDLFLANIFIVIISSGIGILASVFLLVKDNKHRDFASIYEFWSRLLLCGFVIYFFVAWNALKPMHDEFDELIHSFLDIKATPETIVEELGKTTDHFFEVKTHIYAENKWVDAMRITGFLMLYLQFLQIILYLNVHPRMALLTRTLQLACDNIVHFFTLFLFIFIMLAYMVHWLLGGDLFQVFGSFSEAFMSQTRMIFGEWIYSAGVDDLHGVWLAMYWVWAATFMLLVFFILLNFFLAIIVDAFVVVKELIEKQVTECSFPFDCYDAFATTFKFSTKGWPSKGKIYKILESNIPKWDSGDVKTSIEIDDDENTENPAMYASELEALFGSQKALATFLSYYMWKVPDILVPHSDEEPSKEEGEAQQNASAKKAEQTAKAEKKKLFKIGAEVAMTKFVRSVFVELQEREEVDWDLASGRLALVLHRELRRKGSIDP